MTHFFPLHAQPAWRNGSASVSGAGGCGFDPHRGWFVFNLALCKIRSRQDSNLRGQSPVDFWSTPLTAWVRLLLLKGSENATSWD